MTCPPSQITHGSDDLCLQTSQDKVSDQEPGIWLLMHSTSCSGVKPALQTTTQPTWRTAHDGLRYETAAVHMYSHCEHLQRHFGTFTYLACFVCLDMGAELKQLTLICGEHFVDDASNKLPQSRACSLWECMSTIFTFLSG